MREALCLHAQVQRCTLLSIKTGGCPETCTYCSQSSSWRKDTGLKAEKLMDLEDVYQARGNFRCLYKPFTTYLSQLSPLRRLED